MWDSGWNCEAFRYNREKTSMEEFSPILLKKNNEVIFEEIIEEEKVGISMKLCKSWTGSFSMN